MLIPSSRENIDRAKCLLPVLPINYNWQQYPLLPKVHTIHKKKSLQAPPANLLHLIFGTGVYFKELNKNKFLQTATLNDIVLSTLSTIYTLQKCFQS